MKEQEFLKLLQARAREQKQLMDSIPFPKFFLFITEWLSVHPWRFLIPLAFILSIVFRMLYGSGYTSFILTLFRWL